MNLYLTSPLGPVRSVLTDAETATVDVSRVVFLRPGQTSLKLYTVEQGKRIFLLQDKPVTLTGDDLLYHVRKVRSVLLAKSDWTMMPDNGLTDAKRAEWKAYRQALRNFPATPNLAYTTPFPITPQ